jgi:hypothetical protein
MLQDDYKITKAYPGNHTRQYGEIEITSEGLIYTELQDTHSGCQSRNLDNNTLILKKCKEISKLIKEIDSLNVIKAETTISEKWKTKH